MYKIRDRQTGLFSTGGCNPRWSTVGKTWRNLGHVKAHVALVPFATYVLADLVSVETVEVFTAPLSDLTARVEDARMAEKKRRQDAERKRIEREERAELRRLKEKYEP